MSCCIVAVVCIKAGSFMNDYCNQTQFVECVGDWFFCCRCCCICCMQNDVNSKCAVYKSVACLSICLIEQYQ